MFDGATIMADAARRHARATAEAHALGAALTLLRRRHETPDVQADDLEVKQAQVLLGLDPEAVIDERALSSGERRLQELAVEIGETSALMRAASEPTFW